MKDTATEIEVAAAACYRDLRTPPRLPLEPDELRKLFADLAPGQGLVYHRGFLARDRDPTTAHGAAVNAAAALAMQLGSPRGSPTRFNQQWQKPAPRGLGLGTLVQIPLDDCQPFGMGQKGTWAYVLIKNRAEDPARRAHEFLKRREGERR